MAGLRSPVLDADDLGCGGAVALQKVRGKRGRTRNMNAKGLKRVGKRVKRLWLRFNQEVDRTDAELAHILRDRDFDNIIHPWEVAKNYGELLEGAKRRWKKRFRRLRRKGK